MKLILLFISMVCLFAKMCLADINHDLNHFFNSLGYSNNNTSPGVYHNQQLGYYTGGNLSARKAVRQLHMAQVQFPTLRSGCNGIDLFTGGFSFVNSKELEATAKNILNNAVGYTFELALETATPMVNNVLHKLQSQANLVTQCGLNTCAASASLVGGFWPRYQTTQKRICQDIGTGSAGLFSDWAAARQACGSGDKIESVLKKGRANPAYQDQIIEGNLVWRAMQRHQYYQDDPNLRALLMSLSGTIIITRDPKTHAFTKRYYPPKASNKAFLSSLLHGGNVALYQCHDQDSARCENLFEKTVVIESQNAFVNRVNVVLSRLSHAIVNDTPLSDADISFLNTTQIPIYKILSVNAAYFQQRAPIHFHRFAKVIALDILLQYLHESVQVVQAAVQSVAYSPKLTEEFRRGVEQSYDYINQARAQSAHDLALLSNLVQESKVMERYLNGKLSVQLAQAMR